MIYSTNSVKGQAREENRDCVGALFDGVRGIFIIVDGTSKPGSGRLAQALIDQILAGYQARVGNGCSDSCCEQVESLLRDVLHDAHTSVFARDFTGSASYLVAVVTCGFMTIAYEGDCCAGVVMPDGPISWLTAPHCLANWRQDREHRQLATDLGRHRISRSFKVRRKPDPEIFTKEILGGETLVFATDGFWADLSDAIQARLLDAEPVAAPCADDDVSWIVVRIPS